MRMNGPIGFEYYSDWMVAAAAAGAVLHHYLRLSGIKHSRCMLKRLFRPRASVSFGCFIYLVYLYGRPNRPHYGSCPSVVCPPVFDRYY